MRAVPIVEASVKLVLSLASVPTPSVSSTDFSECRELASRAAAVLMEETSDGRSDEAVTVVEMEVCRADGSGESSVVAALDFFHDA